MSHGAMLQNSLYNKHSNKILLQSSATRMTEQAFRGARCGVLDNLVQCPTQHLVIICKEHASQTLGSSSGVICKEVTTATLSVVQLCTITNGNHRGTTIIEEKRGQAPLVVACFEYASYSSEPYHLAVRREKILSIKKRTHQFPPTTGVRELGKVWEIRFAGVNVAATSATTWNGVASIRG